ncbi:MAG: sigma-70 family RNA polymerase sigma factor [Verrucomicrobia bacterium]|nr:sigma-70 family RNA polymerase sigma factor [Verrucomicrobiota bacterium]
MTSDCDAQPENGQFHTTRWSLVMTAAQSGAEASQAAFAQLYQTYWYPLYAFARRRGYSPEDAQDLTQGFFVHLVENRSLATVSPLKGRFRTFLLTSFRNFMSNEIRRALSLKRGGNISGLDFTSAEERFQLEPVDYLTAEKIYDARWAMILLQRSLTRLEENYRSTGKHQEFAILKQFIGGLSPHQTISYEQAAAILGVTLAAVKTLIHRIRKQYSAILRSEIAWTVQEPADVNDEILSLCDALIAASGRLAI